MMQSMIIFPITIFAVVPSISAFLLDKNPPLRLPSASAGNRTNTSIIAFLPSNDSTSTPISEDVSYYCNRVLGDTLTIPSCHDTIRLIGVNRTDLSFGLRDTPGADFDVPLPQRVISSDGTCVVEPSLAAGEEEARASWEDVAVAGFVLVKHCVGEGEGSGGVAKGIGGDNNLQVYVSEYDPSNVRCYGRMRRPNVQASCQQIIDRMEADETNVVFGPQSDPLARVRLPYLLLSDDRACKITIRTTGTGDGHTDVWTWSKMWEVAVALLGMCVREGKEGVETLLGDYGYLYMEVGGPQSESESESEGEEEN
ncbi:MAG: hypothetical protein Q9161_008462 [Pseudevernia consocians]